MSECKTKWDIQIDRMNKHQWSFGICISHYRPETYLFINFFKWSISIGKLLVDSSE
mgnify:CR=1 FL=1